MRNDSEIFRRILTGFVAEEDPLLSMMKWMMDQLMKIEAEQKVGAVKGEHSSERKSYFSGYRPRRFDTRLGTVYLMIPKIRKGGYIPFFITEKRRSEQALISMVKEAYVNGVSTRKIERLAKELGIANISASQVSQINKGLDKQVEEFRNRPLEKEYPFVWVDALYEKVRNYEGRVVSSAIMIAYGVSMEGKREVLAIEPFSAETTETWKAFFDRLKERGVEKIALLISDTHYGIQRAFKETFIGASWQRCKVHFMRNIIAHIPPKAKEMFAAKLKQIWLQESKKDAIRVAQNIIEEFSKKFPEAIEVLQNGLEDSLQFYHFTQIDKRRISSTNVLERINKEIRRRSRVVSIFPSKESYLRLIASYLMEYTEDWEVERSYIRPEKLQEVMEIYEAQLKAA
ncbi:IS256 family transposase [Hydrogenimonas thermophila]|uniref:Mutator family transposase n=1 Tax=Hydrogenimonas thermophila TaxID=223786 RepID=A0A1I5V4R2_9BACT|nr:IS256 family transposase [Hydrogenimonas thermophila]SFQ02327.1 Transposase (or an inactivated derivative) [Hydrogenimonas thermophila]SFQ02513.1 Transposase (or an inactivated derivative) [Hydrogenimonas thermophila]